MSNRIKSFGLAAFYLAVIFLVGCIPEDSLQWSEDGSTGLLRKGGELYLVDGESGELTKIATDIMPWPDISDDGKLVAYCRGVKCSNISESLKMLPAGQVKMIKFYAEQTKKNILDAGGLTDGRFPFPEEGLLLPNDYRNWSIQYLCENADDKLLEVLGKEEIEKGKEEEFGYFRIIVGSAVEPNKVQVVANSVFGVMGVKLSPNKKFLAYLMHTQEGEVSNSFEEVGLYVASLEGDVNMALVNHPVTLGFDWRPDSKAVAYIKARSKNLRRDDFVVSTLEESIVADANGNLLVKSIESGEKGAAGMHRCPGENSEFAGLIFNPWLKVVYGSGGRLFFSGTHLSVPTSTKDEPRWSVFCYDTVTATVTDVLGGRVSNYSGEVIGTSQFDLSPDGKKVLLPMPKNRFSIYRFSDSSTLFPLNESEEFGEDIPSFLAGWKGNDEISALVSENSRFLKKEDEQEDYRKEIVIFGADGQFRRVLSESWPDLLDK
ncbi:MAG: hypothetical protein GWN67_11010 [Phycisphaerae bacterium]|nr:hypothetical protein [Phycisphaerae bacterium]NIP56072.1 hypothetical protein [Phycisphaerae bacterium]NIS51632.1 hypothetical protein [Phycisphaerae bacterium]NIU09226.1 hypothetical protein [Phycisphaerae bacterium]NIU56887.1 hypothetical protein [Phycisphaerae bacterium]